MIQIIGKKQSKPTDYNLIQPNPTQSNPIKSANGSGSWEHPIHADVRGITPSTSGGRVNDW